MRNISLHKIKRMLAGLVLLLCVTALNAQEDYISKQKEEYERFKNAYQQNYDEFLRQANEDYARFMREQWKSFDAFNEEQQPLIPEPSKPYESGNNISEKELLKPLPAKPIPMPEAQPVEITNRPDEQIPESDSSAFHFTSYGTEFSVRAANELRFKLPDINENSVANAWTILSSPETLLLVYDCLNIKAQYSLGDWAYCCLLRDFSKQFFAGDNNEAVLMQLYLLIQSGYKVRIGKYDDNLYILCPFDGVVYGWSGIKINKKTYYIINSTGIKQIYVFNKAFSNNERVMSLRMPCVPQYAYQPTESKTFTSKHYPELSVDIAVNQNLIDFYNDYPHGLLPNYYWAGLSEDVKDKLYPVIQDNIAGKTQIEAANHIMNFLQTAFEYKTDYEQFGYERALFGDEMFFYTYSDCEDRAILFAILIHDILDLDVVLLQYSSHVAPAVNYTEDLNGSYYLYKGKKYYISDPTYINANVGECIPKYQQEKPKLYKL